ncbi:MAG: BMC domain-containing protein [Romboutsia sp.]|uniref:BMC domain-containing protein n=1 Tax=Romboutsia sp. TaxID=1965302 RepID=UPI003F2C1609
MSKSIGAIEFKSIAKGIELSNEIVKKSFVEVLYLKSICPGKFLIIISGETSYVNESIDYGLAKGSGYIVDSFVINAISEVIINGLKHKYEKLENITSIGVVETNKVCAGIKALDKTLKSSEVYLIKLQLSFAIGGKLVYIVAGDLDSLEYGIKEGTQILNSKEIVNTTIIPSVDCQIIKNLI